MERSPAKPPTSRRRPPAAAAEALPEDDRFAPHRGETIDAVYVIGRAVELIIERPREVVGVMLASLGLSALLLFAFVTVGVTNNLLWTEVGIDGVMHPASMMVLMVLGWSCALLLQAPLVGSAIEVHTRRRGLYAEFFGRGVTHLSSLVLASLAVLGITAVALTVGLVLQLVVITITAFVPVQFLVVMLRFAGFVAIVVAVLRVITTFSIVVPVIVVEQLPAGDALRRSWALGWPNSFHMLLALLLPALAVQGVLLVMGYLPAFISIPCYVLGGVGLALYQSVLAPVSYVAIREYVDGLDPERLVSRSRR